MGKQNTLTVGQPAKDLVKDIRLDAYKAHAGDLIIEGADTAPVMEIADLAGGIAPLINTGTCLNEEQAKEIYNIIVLGFRNEEQLRRVEQLAELINSFRLDCQDCINENCGYRDPDYPAEQVKMKYS